MRAPCTLARPPTGGPCRRRQRPWQRGSRRGFLTLAIESSCDDSCVAILQKKAGTTSLLFNRKVTSDNREFRGVHPLKAAVWHTAHLAPLVRDALRTLPEPSADQYGHHDGLNTIWIDGKPHRKPDLVAATRGPGMLSNLVAGLNTAKGLAAAWDVPLLGVHHMQAHALTPRLVTALERAGRQQHNAGEKRTEQQTDHSQSPAFPFLSLLVSGGHTLLVHSRSLCDHRILAEAQNIAIGDMLDKCARAIIPPATIAAGRDVMYGPLLEKFAFSSETSLAQGKAKGCGDEDQDGHDYDYVPPPKRVNELEIFDSGRGWTLTPLLPASSAMTYDFAGFGGQVQRLILQQQPEMSVEDRRLLAKHTMRLAFEHLASRLLFALKDDSLAKDTGTVVVAGGVASNWYLMHILRSMLEVRGFGHLNIIAPPPDLCTDNAAMIAWTAMEMYEAGWRSELSILAQKKWPLDPRAEEGGVLEVPGWVNVNIDTP